MVRAVLQAMWPFGKFPEKGRTESGGSHVKTGSKTLSMIAAAVVAAVLGAGLAQALELKTALEELLVNDKSIRAAEADVAAARERAKASLKEWFPDFSLTGNYGYEIEKKGQGENDSYLPPREVDLKLTQLLWDFGTANATIEQARLALEQAQATLEQRRQDAIRDGAIAYLNLLRAARVVEFSRASEANLKRQTELEDAKVARGAGLSTDVLQAKSQLAGAQAKQVDRESGLVIAGNDFRKAFGFDLVNLSELVQPRIPLDALPATVAEAFEIGIKENPSVRLAKNTVALARQSVIVTRNTEFLPKLNAIGEWKQKEDVGGTRGGKTEKLVKVELSYNFDMGFTAVNSLRAAKHNLVSTESLELNEREKVEQSARNSWEQLQSQKRVADNLNNQANIAAEFLELARKERALGNRSLIDVLAGETALIEAQIDALRAETETAIAAFRLLNAMGRLNMDAIR